MAQIGATLQQLRHRFIECLADEGGDDLGTKDIVSVLDRAIGETACEIADGPQQPESKPATVRKKRGPNRKNKPGVETDSGATD